MRSLSHLAALLLAIVVAALVATPATTAAELVPTTHANTAGVAAAHLAAAQPRVIDEDDAAWVCWLDGNARCSSVPLDGPGDVPAGQPGWAELGVPEAVCSTDADCAAYDLARGIVSDGRP